MGGGHAAGGQDGPHLPLGEQEGLLLLAGLVLFDHVPQLAVDGLDHVIAAILRQRLPQEGFKGLLLDGGRHGRRGAEQGVNELRVVLPDVPGVVEGIIEVGGALRSKAGKRKPASGGETTQSAFRSWKAFS